MAVSLSVNIADDAKAARVIDAVCATYGYPEQVPDPAWVDPGDGSTAPLIDNPQSKRQFVQTHLRQHLREITRAHEIQAARRQAEESADNLGTI